MLNSEHLFVIYLFTHILFKQVLASFTEEKFCMIYLHQSVCYASDIIRIAWIK